jgi:16S rRNA (adenine1518-N6/adenine1519-N6)-dimethyltransferase
MPLYRPSELRDFLLSIDKNPLRFSSQRFLIDGNVVAKIVGHVIGKNVLEIGPGPGVLTEALLQNGHKTVAVEKDPDFAKALTRLSPELAVMHADILQCSLEAICHDHFPGDKISVVSNLPYHLTTPIIEWLLSFRHLFSKAILMVQKEAGYRLTAKKGGLLPLLLAYCGNLSLDFIVSKNSFWPKPSIDSAVIIFEPLPKPLLPEKEEQNFFKLLREISTHKRKTMLHQLSTLLGRTQALIVLEKAVISPQARPEELSLDAFLRLSSFVSLECVSQ